jgi:thioredoxin reductase (NADPH)
VRLYERLLDLRGAKGEFTVVTSRGEHRAGHVVIAVGFYDVPNRLDVPGGDLPKVTHYYREPYPYVGQKVAVIGAKNSAAKAALDCYRHGAEVTLVVRSTALSSKIKYWLKPDLENRIKEGSIRAFFSTLVERIDPASVTLRTPDGIREIANDWVLAMTGYRPDYRLLEGSASASPTMPGGRRCSTRPPSRQAGQGVYLAGTVCGGLTTRAAGSSRTAASTPARSPSTSRAAVPRRCSFEGHPLEDGGVGGRCRMPECRMQNAA